MSKETFTLVDEHEHEFNDATGLSVAFATQSILPRDGVVEEIEPNVVENVSNGVKVRTLSAEAFRGAYSFSVKDGYRKDKRGKNDAEIIALLDEYLGSEAYTHNKAANNIRSSYRP